MTRTAESADSAATPAAQPTSGTPTRLAALDPAGRALLKDARTANAFDSTPGQRRAAGAPVGDRTSPAGRTSPSIWSGKRA